MARSNGIMNQGFDHSQSYEDDVWIGAHSIILPASNLVKDV